MTGASAARVLAGADGCRKGWVAVIRRNGQDEGPVVFARFSEMVAALGDDFILAVDMPMGLPDRAGSGGRGPERLVRTKLRHRQSAVFSVPSRAAVEAESPEGLSWEEALTAHRRASRVARETSDPPRGVSIQAFFLFPKIREIDGILRERPDLRDKVIESHPEVAFWQLRGGLEMDTPKKVKGKVNPEGMAERRSLLAGKGIAPHVLHAPAPAGAGEDDCLDAMACLLVAERHAQGIAQPFPDPPGRDRHGIAMAIWV